MSESDLRPPGAGQKPAPEPITRRANWWQPLASKWGILGLLIFIGLAISFVENVGRLFSGQTTPSRPRYSDYNERTKLDAKATGELLIQVLSRLPGDNPKEDFYLAHTLAYEYGYKWDKENTAREAAMSEINRREQKQLRDANYQKVSSDLYRQLGNPRPDHHPMIIALKDAMDQVDGGTIHYFGQKINASIEAAAEKVKQALALKGEVEKLISEFKSAPESDRRKIRERIRARVTAYNEIEEIRRGLPSTPADPQLLDKHQAAHVRLFAIPTLSNDDAVKIFVDNLVDASEHDVLRLLDKLNGRHF